MRPYATSIHTCPQELLAAAIKLERRLPSPVARVQGSRLRPATESNVDIPLFAALADKLALLKVVRLRPHTLVA
jgi:hypothetical protein